MQECIRILEEGNLNHNKMTMRSKAQLEHLAKIVNYKIHLHIFNSKTEKKC